MKVHLTIGVSVICMSIIACNSDAMLSLAERDSEWIRELSISDPCSKVAFDVTPQKDSTSCVLALAIVNEVAEGKGEYFGFPKSDTARVSNVAISEQVIGDGTEGPREYFWRAFVTVDGRAGKIASVFNRQDHTIGIKPEEIWILK